MPSAFTYTGQSTHSANKAKDYHSKKQTPKKASRPVPTIKMTKHVLDKSDFTWSKQTKYLNRSKFSHGLAKLNSLFNKKSKPWKQRAFNKMRPVYDLT